MIQEIVSMALESGIWAALFCFLFLYMLKDSRTRETKYTSTIETLGSQLSSLMDALKVCDRIESDCSDNLTSTNEIKGDTQKIREDVEIILKEVQ